MRYVNLILIAALAGATPAIAQHGKVPDQDPVRVKYADSRQYRNEPRGNAAKRMTRCKIVVRKGQDKRVCGVPTNRSPGDGRNR
ncbi:MAG: hypothetical protein EOO38_30980 [Cytophagaceae bacterium]|jgi:hypothetical protein|uniref:Secreted protein n=1 Tax=Sphingomonas longa TaxID=2778730 RepID=A0ABS2D9N1_9SPHN|nr:MULTISPECIES: hypothetical protein [Alphaproteobacteria]MBM6577646.1 hypothetical protein [Sphingomonas sp. BT552]MBR7710689.1 hypothetical protein [Microvirga sp. SRT01]RYF32445.1 MAG: hypothetical protein EOO38_30980 [Cytophagaceae bacterium]